MDAIDPRLIRALELQGAGRIDQARPLFAELLAEQPQHFVCLYSLALIELNRGLPEPALAMIDRAIVANPGFAASHALRGMALQALDRPEDALAAMDRSLALDAAAADVWINRGVLLHGMKRPWEALSSFDRALEVQPASASALGNRGTLLSELNRHQESADCFQQLVELAPDHDYALGLLAFARRHCCDWHDSGPLLRRIEQGIRSGRRVCKTLALMALCEDPELHLKAARIFAEHRYPAPPPSQRWVPPPRQGGRIRLAYISPDFREHPVGHLTAGLFERHDRSRFEVIGVSIGIDDGSAIAQRIRLGFDRFVELRGRTTATIVATLRALQIDIAIDLAGYTADARTDLFAQRVAPVQVNWLGYPGTLGSDYHDYILADRTVIPTQHRSYFSEQVIYLRDSYLPTDDALEVAAETPPRSAFGLPEQGFVFCAFNHDYKIAPAVFAVWMHLLRELPTSVLWLMRLHQAAQDHLRAAAVAAGVDPERLIFATRVPKVQDHLARYRLADLFLDTSPYNAHTTAADALYAGLPVLSYRGHSFAGRVAASLLQTLGVPELITDSLEHYQARALELARDPAQLAALRQRVAGGRGDSPLFDTGRFVRSLEEAYEGIQRRVQAGLPATSFAVDELELPPPTPAPAVRPLQRLRIGGREPVAGWRNLHALPGPAVDLVGVISDLSLLPSASLDEVYAAHELARVTQAAMIPTLRGLRRVLRADGRLLLSVPDLDVLCRLFQHPQASKEDRFRIMRMLFGGQVDAHDFHLIGLNYEFLADYLAAAGFRRLERVRSFGLFQDQSEAVLFGERVSLNVIVYP